MDRDANFRIVFWTGTSAHRLKFLCSPNAPILDNCHATVKTGASDYSTASRALARKQLFNHIVANNLPLSCFADLSDPNWISFYTTEKVSLLWNCWYKLSQQFCSQCLFSPVMAEPFPRLHRVRRLGSCFCRGPTYSNYSGMGLWYQS
jgi:hypothetical protein